MVEINEHQRAKDELHRTTVLGLPRLNAQAEQSKALKLLGQGDCYPIWQIKEPIEVCNARKARHVLVVCDDGMEIQ